MAVKYMKKGWERALQTEEKAWAMAWWEGESVACLGASESPLLPASRVPEGEMEGTMCAAKGSGLHFGVWVGGSAIF